MAKGWHPRTPLDYRIWRAVHYPDKGYMECLCGCGMEIRRATGTYPEIWQFRGEPRRYLKGHSRRRHSPTYSLEDRGYRGAAGPCWIPTQRPRARRAGKVMSLARALFEDAFGLVPRGFHLKRECGQSDCVNPDHAGLARVAAARAAFGMGEVRQIRNEYDRGAKQADLARRYDVAAATIHNIVHHLSYRETDSE